jgi:hypothetical protein
MAKVDLSTTLPVHVIQKIRSLATQPPEGVLPYLVSSSQRQTPRLVFNMEALMARAQGSFREYALLWSAEASQHLERLVHAGATPAQLNKALSSGAQSHAWDQLNGQLGVPSWKPKPDLGIWLASSRPFFAALGVHLGPSFIPSLEQACAGGLDIQPPLAALTSGGVDRFLGAWADLEGALGAHIPGVAWTRSKLQAILEAPFAAKGLTWSPPVDCSSGPGRGHSADPG